MPIVSYARFSPRPGAAECESCDVQLADNRRWAEERHLEIRTEQRDDALSGFGRDDERDGLHAAISACRRNDIFLVRDFDRLSRDNYSRLGYMVELTKRGVRMISRTEGEYLPRDKESKLLFGVLAAMGEYRRDCIREATSSKMRQHQANGRAMGGKPPYGWKRDAKRLVEVPAEQLWIPRIVELHADGLSLRTICRRLDELEAPCRGKKWSRTTIKAILRRAGVELGDA